MRTNPTSHSTAGEITRLLAGAQQGNREALDALLPLVYDEMRRIAHGRLRSERDGHTLNTTALVHEAYLKLVDQTRVEWQSRGHFFAVAAEAMRRILVDYAKGRRASKRGGGAGSVELEAARNVSTDSPFTDDEALELIELDGALDRLAAFNRQGALVVQYRFFGGLSTDEVAEVLGCSERTVRRSWTAARAWLRSELERSLPPSASSLLGFVATGR
jgi:RNA polymerase sigma factor (TIGR02999 family)